MDFRRRFNEICFIIRQSDIMGTLVWLTASLSSVFMKSMLSPNIISNDERLIYIIVIKFFFLLIWPRINDYIYSLPRTWALYSDQM